MVLFPNEREGVVGKGKEKKLMLKKQTKTRVLNVSCSLVALLRAFFTKTVVVCCSAP